MRGQARQYGSRPAQAAPDYEAARTLMAEAGDVHGEVRVLQQLAELRMKDGDYTSAIELLRQTAALLPEGEVVETYVVTRVRIGYALVQLGEYGQAHAIVSGLLGMARDPLSQVTGYRLYEASSLSDVAVALRHLGRLEDALARHAQALKIAEEAGEAQFELGVLIPYAQTCLAAGDREAAAGHYRAALDIATSLGLRHLGAVAGDALAELERPIGVPSRPGTPRQQLLVAANP